MAGASVVDVADAASAGACVGVLAHRLAGHLQRVDGDRDGADGDQQRTDRGHERPARDSAAV